ncbi:hypothetical protein [Sulfurisphaera ohwakuensis]|uniref:Uncharacterized protein n=1 Tax=Sulfurisphaera ohwakuensis TaxID=69656 RepID=A0A650CG59_SULOH|nr:hypothetical protein [Sulfurisphaera ohwakuensis]MBB5254243.1 hypothetical protein [Sulfurisphaera ohwakuensis]QGR16834.1 hypothetical protein D1869_06270 [Sulfurisphaera ohwakuensis]
MEFLNKRDRLVLTTISQYGPAGIDASALISLLSPLMTKESIMRSVEELIIKDLVKVTNLGQGEVRYVSSKNVRDAMINLDIQRLKIAEYVKELNTRKDEILKLQDKNQQIEQLRNTVLEGLSIISIGLINLYSSMPELTIPEYIESIQPLIEVMEKLYKLVQKSYTKEETEAILKIIEKYRGEKDYRILKEMLEKEEMSQKDKSI